MIIITLKSLPLYTNKPHSDVLKKTASMFKSQLKTRILENRNICSKNKDLFSLINSQEIQINKILTGVRLAPEARLVTDSRFKVTFYDSKKDNKFKDWMKSLKEKFEKTREFNFDINHIWNDFIVKDDILESSRSQIDTSLSNESKMNENEGKIVYPKTEDLESETTEKNHKLLDVTLYSEAIRGKADRRVLNNFFERNKGKISNDDNDNLTQNNDSYSKNNSSNFAFSPANNLLTPLHRFNSDKETNDFKSYLGGIERINELTEDKKEVYGVDYINVEHFRDPERVREVYRKNKEFQLIKEIFDLMIRKGKIPKVFKDESNMNIRVVLIKRYCRG